MEKTDMRGLTAGEHNQLYVFVASRRTPMGEMIGMTGNFTGNALDISET